VVFGNQAKKDFALGMTLSPVGNDVMVFMAPGREGKGLILKVKVEIGEEGHLDLSLLGDDQPMAIMRCLLQ